MTTTRTEQAITLTLPYPPSVNRMWRNVKGRTLISREGRAYRQSVFAAVLEQIGVPEPLTDRLAVWVTMHQPDAKRRDVDNVFKGPLDALEKAGVFANDSQIDGLSVVRGSVDRENPRVEVYVQVVENALEDM